MIVPQLGAALADTDKEVRYDDAYALESATNLTGPFSVESAVLSTNQQTVNATLPAANPRKFFRLRKL